MNVGLCLATTNIVLSVGAFLGYLISGDLKHAIYWGSAALLTYSVTYM